MSPVARKPVFGFPTRNDKTGLYDSRRWLEVITFEFRKQRKCSIFVEKNKGAGQLRSYSTADLRPCFRIYKKQVFSRHNSATNVCY